MRRVQNAATDRHGTTLVELTVAVAIMAVVFAAIMPLFAGVRNSADTRWAGLEMVQNARVLNEQFCRHLAAARRVTAASADTSDNGYVQFEAADGASYRCALGAGGYVEFGPVGNLSELVGPVDYLRFVCYDGNDLVNPAPTPEGTRLVTWEAGLRSAGPMTRGKIIRGACYLRVSARGAENTATYDFATCRPGTDCFAFADQGELQVPDQPDVPAEVFDAAGYDGVTANDGQFHAIEVSDAAEFAQIRLTFQIEPEEGDVTAITPSWNGKGVNEHPLCTDGAALHIWNWSASRYELLHASANTEAEITLAGSGGAAAADYIGGDAGKTVMLLVVSNSDKSGAGACTLFTDYVKIDVASVPGGEAVVP